MTKEFWSTPWNRNILQIFGVREMKTILELSRNTLLKKIALALKHVLKLRSSMWKNWLTNLENHSPSLFLPPDVCLLQIFWSLFQLLYSLAQGATTCAFGSLALKMYVSVLTLWLEAALHLKRWRGTAGTLAPVLVLVLVCTIIHPECVSNACQSHSPVLFQMSLPQPKSVPGS